MKKQLILMFMTGALSVGTFSAFAAAPTSAVQHTPGQINYQGKLVKTDGNLVTDGAYTLAIRLYRVSTAGTAIWGGQYVTYVKGGYFNLMLGGAAGVAVIPAPTYAHDALWRALWPDPAIPSEQKNTLFLGVTPVAGVAGQLIYGSEITPRQNLLAAPYAFRAQSAEYANQAYAAFKVGGAFEAGYNPAAPSSIALRTYMQGSAPYLDIGVSGTGETKLQSAITRVTSGQLIVSSPTQSFTAGAGNFAVNSGAGNITMGGNNATINMSGNVNISGAGNDGTRVGTTSRPLMLSGSQIAGRGPLLWNTPDYNLVGEKPFTVRSYTVTVAAGATSKTFALTRSESDPTPMTVSDYSAMVVGWSVNTTFTTHKLETIFYSDGKWQLQVTRSPTTGNAVYSVTILFINKHMIDDSRTVTQQG
ncbi:MAG: hypothetical protein PHO37_03790 [Kiritimatiellae bacterium]|nr:hypothetical protein [Kiritimatiellia bacterium]